MRIGVSTSVVQRGKTGVAQYLFALLRAFAAQPQSHEFVLFVLEEDLPLFTFLQSRMKFCVVAEKFRAPIKNILWHQTTLPELVTREKLDVLHVPSYRRMLWPRPCPLVATIHDLAPFHVAGKYDWKRMIYGRMVARRLAHRQNQIIAISENTAQDILKFFGLPRNRISVIHNGLEHERFFAGEIEAAKSSVAQNYGVREPFFLYLARLEHPGKNHVRLLAAFERFKSAHPSNWQLVFGGSDWHGAEQIHAAIKQSGFASDVRTLGFVPDNALPELYRAADVFVYPSLYEGFGMPPIEAMACGCPVICSTRGSLGEVVQGAAAIVDPEDVNSMANQLSILATDGETRNRLRAAGFAQAQKFSWSKTANETLKIYERAVKGLD